MRGYGALRGALECGELDGRSWNATRRALARCTLCAGSVPRRAERSGKWGARMRNRAGQALMLHRGPCARIHMRERGRRVDARGVRRRRYSPPLGRVVIITNRDRAKRARSPTAKRKMKGRRPCLHWGSDPGLPADSNVRAELSSTKRVQLPLCYEGFNGGQRAGL